MMTKKEKLKEAYYEVIMAAHGVMGSYEEQELVTIVEDHAIELGILDPHTDYE